MQTSRGRRGGGMRGKLLLLHQQGLVQLALMLLDLLLHVGDCTCNLEEKERGCNELGLAIDTGVKMNKKGSQREGWSWNRSDRILRKKWHKQGLVHRALWGWRVEDKKGEQTLSVSVTETQSVTQQQANCCHGNILKLEQFTRLHHVAVFVVTWEIKACFVRKRRSYSWSHNLHTLWCVDSLAALVVEWGQKHCVAPASSAAGFVNAGTPSL